jgi:hypothetical protein
VCANDAVGPGGGIGNEGVLTVSDSTVSGNFASQIANLGGTAAIINSTISSDGQQFGGIINLFGMLTIKNSSVSGTEFFQHSGVGCEGGTLAITDSTVSGCILGAPLTMISGCTVTGRILVNDPNGALTVDYSTVMGGIEVDYGNLALDSSNVSGGIYCNASYGDWTYSVSHSTVSGGIYLWSGAGTLSVSLSNISGGIYVTVGTLSVSGSSVSGGIYNTYAAGAITVSADSTVDFFVGPYTIV